MSTDDVDATSWPELRERIVGHEGGSHEPRTYPGYPRVALEAVKPRLLVRLDATLLARRSVRELGATVSVSALSRILRFAHGVTGPEGRGATPSAGGLQALEVYVAVLKPQSWAASGVYHYDRAGHFLSRLNEGSISEHVPSLGTVTGGALLWVLVGDGARVRERYGDRATRFLALEAGHLMQNLCLLSTSEGLATVPLGVFFERAIARQLALLPDDLVLYCGVCG